jgi:UDP-GlcNAc:undecaprenyl-phosphate GlcNAc-1-phosphate transferase
VAAAGAVVAFGFYFRSVSLPLLHAEVELGWLGPLLTFLWIIGVSNAVNLIDGLDGLAGSLNLLILLFFGLLALHAGNLSAALLCFSFSGALLAFLVFNLPPASIFMGDSGSLMLGFCLAVIPLAPVGAEFGPKMLPFIFSLVLVPVYDTIAAIVRRRRQGKPFYTPDKGHIHHKLLSLGCSNRAILLILGGVTFIAGGIAYLWIALDAPLLLDILPAFWLLYALGFVLLARRFRAGQLHPSP